MVDELRAERDAPEGLDTSTVQPARRYNYWLGGTDNFAVDRESGDLIERAHPSVRVSVRENRVFLQRAVGFLAEAGLSDWRRDGDRPNPADIAICGAVGRKP
ncbi:SAM-dependent methyltransferase [Actinoplanes sp. LDG1-06]|uniref:SAM-dependent methyltransferase n=1 Tax=Paractinoplanes ovalisporus TaxID=2810368 RepID=A0ABS2AIM7_9ACTN|nr:SAM-dependent methyltransferase [Actinoplanes ovalisporus]MBM2619640.1 SAM-dependent methyltransferase [Actinoplanes ovalisporus]